LKLTPLENWIMDRTGIATKSRADLEAYQYNQLIQTLNYCKEKSLYYKKTLEHIDIDSIQSFKDFVKIPFTDSENIKKNALDFLCVSQSEVKRIITINTSGTSGDEKRIYFTEEDLNHTIDFFQYGMRCLSNESDRVLVLLPGKAYGSIGDLLRKALSLSHTQCIVHGVLTNLEEVTHLIQEYKISCIVGIPMQILYLSRLKSDVFQTYIKKVLLSTDYVPDILVKELRGRFHCDVYNHYGMSEMGYGGGVECEALHGYHLREGDLYFEIIDPQTGESVKDGEYGEVVFTTFHRQAIPLIRYRTGDIARFGADPCACGTFLKTMDKVSGRISNKVLLHNLGEVSLRDLDEAILQFEEVLDYKASIMDGDQLVIELTMSNLYEFENRKEEIIYCIYKRFYFPVHIKLKYQQDNRTPKITNSMIKRKLYDLRTN